MSRFPKLTTLIRSTVVALALGGAAITAAPAQAAPPSVDFHFGFGLGGYGVPQFGTRFCLSNPQVRHLLRRHGYDHIRFFDRRGRIVGVRAEKGKWEYRVWVDSCRARIVDVQRLRRHR